MLDTPSSSHSPPYDAYDDPPPPTVHPPLLHCKFFHAISDDDFRFSAPSLTKNVTLDIPSSKTPSPPFTTVRTSSVPAPCSLSLGVPNAQTAVESVEVGVGALPSVADMAARYSSNRSFDTRTSTLAIPCAEFVWDELEGGDSGTCSSQIARERIFDHICQQANNQRLIVYEMSNLTAYTKIPRREVLAEERHHTTAVLRLRERDGPFERDTIGSLPPSHLRRIKYPSISLSILILFRARVDRGRKSRWIRGHIQMRIINPPRGSLIRPPVPYTRCILGCVGCVVRDGV